MKTTPTITTRRVLAAAAPLLAASAVAAAGPSTGASGSLASPAQPARPATADGVFREIKWDALMPKDWNPAKQFRGRNTAIRNDADPRARQLLDEMREVWDTAPTVEAMAGAAVRLPGHVVPLEEAGGELKEFLLVPYFGACIHTPPPPANQLVFVRAPRG